MMLQMQRVLMMPQMLPQMLPQLMILQMQLVSMHDAMLTGYPGEATVSVDARDVTQVAVNPETISARLDDASDDDGATQATSGLETKTAPTRLPAEGGRSDATTGPAKGMQESRRSQGYP